MRADIVFKPYNCIKPVFVYADAYETIACTERDVIYVIAVKTFQYVAELYMGSVI